MPRTPWLRLSAARARQRCVRPTPTHSRPPPMSASAACAAIKHSLSFAVLCVNEQCFAVPAAKPASGRRVAVTPCSAVRLLSAQVEPRTTAPANCASTEQCMRQRLCEMREGKNPGVGKQAHCDAAHAVRQQSGLGDQRLRQHCRRQAAIRGILFRSRSRGHFSWDKGNGVCEPESVQGRHMPMQGPPQVASNLCHLKHDCTSAGGSCWRKRHSGSRCALVCDTWWAPGHIRAAAGRRARAPAAPSGSAACRWRSAARCARRPGAAGSCLRNR